MTSIGRPRGSRVTVVVRALAGAAAIGLIVSQQSSVEAYNSFTTFQANAPSLGAIPDAPTTDCGQAIGGLMPRNVTFTVAGLSGTVRSVKVSMTGMHGWIGDLDVQIIAPSGASHILLSRTGATTAAGCGDSSNLAGPYTFTDSIQTPPSGGWWQAASAADGATAVASGVYRTVAAGGAGAVNPAPATSINPVVAGVMPNGTWTLRIYDTAGGDAGSITAASIQIATTARGQELVDYDSNGMTDFTVVRDTGGPVTWFTLNSLGVTNTVWGTAATDFFVSGDYDGDGKSDIAVWRPGSATFWVRKSSDGGVIAQPWGLPGDDPRVPGDYDGDGKTDFAVYRCPPVTGAPGQCYFYVLRSSNGTALVQPWGFGVAGNYFAAPGDYDGDGRADFAVQTAAPGNPAAGIFYILQSTAGVASILWGNATDFIVPGDYDGDGKTDVSVRRTVSGQRQHWVRRSSDGGLTFQLWGSSGDSSVPGDYDGDGRTDFAIWRASATPGQSAFWVLRSSNGSVLIQQWGQDADYPVASFIVH